MAAPQGKQVEADDPPSIPQVQEEPQGPANVAPIAGTVAQRRRDKPDENPGGYECVFIHPPPTYIQTDCSICLQVLRSPHLAGCCSHNFCKKCIERVQTLGKPCPLCNRENFTLTYNRDKDVSLQQAEVYCPHRTIGCEWRGKLEMLDTHINVNPKLDKQLEGCAFVEVQCFNDGCGQYFQRPLIVKHQCGECPLRVFSCEHCHEYESTYHDVTTNHWPVCKCYPLPCPHECRQETIQRQNLEQHLNEECTLQEVECEFKYAGCDAKLPRKDTLDHLTKNNIRHTTLLARQNQELITKLLEKDEQLRQVIEENQRVRRAMEDNRREMEESIARLTKHHTESLARRKEEVKTRLAERDELIGEQQAELGNLMRKQEETDGSLKELQGSTAPAAEVATLKNQLGDLARKQEATDGSFKELQDSTAEVATLKNQLEDLAQKQEATDGSLKELQGSTAPATELTTLKNQLGDLIWKQDTSLQKLHHHVHIAPVQIVITDFEQHKQDDDHWYSNGFYTHPQGYKMCVNVDANGNRKGKGTHVSCYISLMHGEFDNHLKWPFRGAVTITLLNQREDKNHHTKTIKFTDKTPDESSARVSSGESVTVGTGWGRGQFFPHSELGYNEATNCEYLVDDCLYFRVKVEALP